MVNRLGRIVTYWVKSWDLGNKTWRCFWMKPARPCGRPRANIQLLMMSLASDSRVCSLLLNAGRLPPNIFPDIQKWTFFFPFPYHNTNRSPSVSLDHLDLAGILRDVQNQAESGWYFGHAGGWVWLGFVQPLVIQF